MRNIRFALHQSMRGELFFDTPLNRRETCYGPTVRAYMEQSGSLLEALAKFLRHIYLKEARNHPYSIAPINTYLFLKEQEIARIIYIIESTHYENQSGTSPAEEALS